MDILILDILLGIKTVWNGVKRKEATSSFRNSPSSFDLKQNLIVMKNNIFPDECQTLPLFQSVLWNCFGGTNFQHGGKFVPQNSPKMYFETISTRSQANLKVASCTATICEVLKGRSGVHSWRTGAHVSSHTFWNIGKFIQHRTSVVIQSLYFAVFVQIFFRYLAK